MALLHKKINDRYINADVYYRIEGIDFTANNEIIVYLAGYSNDEYHVHLDELVYTFEKSKEETVSYEMVYNLLKELPEFENCIDC